MKSAETTGGRVARRIDSRKPGTSVRTDDRPRRCQETAVRGGWAGAWAGGVAVLDAKRRAGCTVRRPRLAQAPSSAHPPSPPGASTLSKDPHLRCGPLEKGVGQAHRRISKINDGINRRRARLHRKRQRRVLRRAPSARPSPESCNFPISCPLGPEDRATRRMVENGGKIIRLSTRRRRLYSPSITKEVETGRVDDPRPKSAKTVDLRGLGDRPGRSAGDAAADWRASPRRSPTTGVRMPTSIVAGKKAGGRRMKPVAGDGRRRTADET